MKKSKMIFKLLSLCMAFLLCAVSFTACASKSTDEPTLNAETVVGTVDGKEVCYDELYFLVHNYINSVKEAHGEDKESINAALNDLISENITANYAILRLYENVGATYNKGDLRDEVKEELESIIANDFSGSEDDYLASLKEYGLTERYLKFTTGVDLLYDQLLFYYPENGLVSAEEPTVRNYIKQNFIRTWHIMVSNDNGEDTAANYQKISEALDQLNSRQATMFDLIGSKYNEDMMLISTDGYYFSKGSMEEGYENAAFDLEINEISGIVEAMGENSLGEYVSCYYIIQRLPLENAYIDEHFSDLQNEYYSSVIYQDMENVRKSLSFVPNDFYSSLDLTDLPLPEETSNTWIWILCVVGGVVLIAAIVTVILLKKKYAKKNIALPSDSSGSSGKAVSGRK